MSNKNFPPSSRFSPKLFITINMSSKRIERISVAAEFFSYLKEAEDLEKKARLLRKRAAKLREEYPLLVNLDNRIDTFGEDKPKKRKAPAEASDTTLLKRKSEVRKKKPTVVPKAAEKPTEILHYHTAEDGEQVACKKTTCGQMEF